jgi:hypothetical protein
MSIALVVLIDILTNSITKDLLFDSKVYIGLAEHGFERSHISPFVYRFAGPFLAGGIHQFAGLSMYKSFKALTYVGAMTQLMGVFLLVRSLAKSEKSAYVGMLTVAVSLYNIKYPLFDVYRPDILTYPILLACTWLALNDHFFLLLLTTMVGLQFREFAIVPLLAYLAVKLQREVNKESIRNVLISIIGLWIAVGIPRLLIPVSQHDEAVQLSFAGMGQAIHLILNWHRDLNIIYIVLAYFLPFLILYSRHQLKIALSEISSENARYLACYSLLVLLLLVVGGTDLERFATYFFLPLAILAGLLAKNQPFMKILLLLTIQIIFNRIWLPFPIWDLGLMINFYGGWSDVINMASLWRFVELAALIILGRFFIHFQFVSKQNVLSSG